MVVDDCVALTRLCVRVATFESNGGCDWSTMKMLENIFLDSFCSILQTTCDVRTLTLVEM